jgi:hypothetical protein
MDIRLRDSVSGRKESEYPPKELRRSGAATLGELVIVWKLSNVRDVIVL